MNARTRKLNDEVRIRMDILCRFRIDGASAENIAVQERAVSAAIAKRNAAMAKAGA